MMNPLRSLLGASLLAALAASPAQAQKLTAQRPGKVDAAVVSFGLFGGQSVFESEAKGAAAILAAKLDAKGRTIVRFNTKGGGNASPETLAAAIRRAGKALDAEEDVLVVALTSHGNQRGLEVSAGRRNGFVAPLQLKAMLQASGVTHRVVIVSACYSGVFARALADSRTLVITAAAADRTSFGCRDGATWTYFGDAFYNRALRRNASLDQAFAEARTLVTARERREGFEPSNPQIAGGEEVLRKLRERRRG